MKVTAVPEVHNQGEPCGHCGLLDHTVQANVITPDGMYECCATCVDDITDGLSDHSIERTTVEMLAECRPLVTPC